MTGTSNAASPDALLTAGRREVASLAEQLAQSEPGHSVHGARRRIKQLRSLLRLLRTPMGVASYQEANAALREAADALAGHRRAEALACAAGKLYPAGGAGGNFWFDVAESHRVAHAADDSPVQAMGMARGAITRASDVLQAAQVDGADGDALMAAYLAAYGKARRLLREGLKSGDPRTLHEARKFVIHHLHHTRLLRPESESRMADLEQLRELLGDLNDLDELQQLAVQPTIAAKETRRIERARTRLLRRTRKAADKLFRHKRKQLAKRLGHAANPHSPHRNVALQAGE